MSAQPQEFHQYPEGSGARRLIDAGYVCIRCGEPLGLQVDVLSGEGLVHAGGWAGCGPALRYHAALIQYRIRALESAD